MEGLSGCKSPVVRQIRKFFRGVTEKDLISLRRGDAGE